MLAKEVCGVFNKYNSKNKQRWWNQELKDSCEKRIVSGKMRKSYKNKENYYNVYKEQRKKNKDFECGIK